MPKNLSLYTQISRYGRHRRQVKTISCYSICESDSKYVLILHVIHLFRDFS